MEDWAWTSGNQLYLSFRDTSMRVTLILIEGILGLCVNSSWEGCVYQVTRRHWNENATLQSRESSRDRCAYCRSGWAGVDMYREMRWAVNSDWTPSYTMVLSFRPRLKTRWRCCPFTEACNRQEEQCGKQPLSIACDSQLRKGSVSAKGESQGSWGPLNEGVQVRTEV